MAFDPTVVRARWSIDWFAAEEIPNFAQEALARGADGIALRRLAGLEKPAKRDIADVVEQAFSEMGLSAPSRPDAFKIVARDVAARIVDGQLDPYDGARQLWLLCCEADYPDDLVPFIALADEHEELPDRRKEIIKDIVDEAKKLVSG